MHLSQLLGEAHAIRNPLEKYLLALGAVKAV